MLGIKSKYWHKVTHQTPSYRIQMVDRNQHEQQWVISVLKSSVIIRMLLQCLADRV
jgi:hypothetical protein